jgi:hypothetical protein
MSVLFQKVQLLFGDGGISSPSVHHKNASTWEEGDGGHREDLFCAMCLCLRRSLHHKQRILQSIALVPSRAHWIETKAVLGNQGSCKLFFVPVSSIALLSQHVCLFVCGNYFFILRAPVPSVLRKGLDAVVESLP